MYKFSDCSKAAGLPSLAASMLCMRLLPDCTRFGRLPLNESKTMLLQVNWPQQRYVSLLSSCFQVRH